MKTIQPNNSYTKEWVSKMRGISLFIFLSSFFIFFSSCTSVDLEDMPDPTPIEGQVTLTTDWANHTAGIEIPTSYTVTINNQTLNYTKPINELPQLSAGTYSTLIHNSAEKIAIKGTKATVSATAGIVDPAPGWLFSSTLDIVYQDDKQKTITAVMQQQVRQLTLTLKPEGGMASRIESITATLSGIAGAWDFKSNNPVGNAMNAPLSFVKQSDGTWQTTVRLLGITGLQQKLSGTITFKDASPSDMPLSSDLSAALLHFNGDKKDPLSLEGDIKETPSEIGLSTSVTDWEKVDQSIIAE